ncbi:protein suppressor of white apricot-like [Rhynchophorus ferrugineus]|uniref:protein suppressor of white apricot-like n=1 Tax=Rhynchophorus ferrugineus TaxID=354439 RepID=UPI003FCD6571
MAQWGTSDSGILRKNRTDNNLEGLLVFGYSCKIFRDDEKALYIDQGKHLIPWMGDEKLKIDRYDCRGALSDLKKFEASREGYDAMRWLGLSDAERKLEELCDTERYYSLEINEEEEEMYKEEEAKRGKTNTFAFNYDTPNKPESEPQNGIPTVPEKEEEEEVYVPLPTLDVPVDISIPKTVKEYARIEKTALFVCRQGPQMEILIKAKQADNPQFSFLTVNDPLYKFYRHILAAFKNGRYHAQCDKKTKEDHNADKQEVEQDSHYLHPSLQSGSAKSNSTAGASMTLPSIPYRPSADCAYSQLVNRIQGTGFAVSNPESNGNGQIAAEQQAAMQFSSGSEGSGQAGSCIEQQYQYYYVQQWYEYWRHAVLNGEHGAAYANLPTDFTQLELNMQNYIHQMAWTQYVQHHKRVAAETSTSNNSYAQIVSNLNKDGGNPYTANVPQLPPQPQQVAVEQPKENPKTEPPKAKPVECKPTLLSLAADYGSDSSESDTSDSEEDGNKNEIYRVPSGEAQIVIDKMADYVAKNGAQFEEIIKAKGDARFNFLNEGHEFYKYYRVKLGELTGQPPQINHKKVNEKPASKNKKVIAPVSFSIKKTKDEVPKEIRSALPMEDSSDEETTPPKTDEVKGVLSVQKMVQVSKGAYKITPVLPQPTVAEISHQGEPELECHTPKTDINNTNEKLSANNNVSPSPERQVRRSHSLSPKKSPSVTKSPKKETPKKAQVIDMFEADTNGDAIKQKAEISDLANDPILELIELDKEGEDVAKDKARQLERKRKAAMFLKLKSVETSNKHERSSSIKDRRSPSRSNSDRYKSRSRTRELSYRKSYSRDRSRSREKRRSRSRERRKDRKRSDKERSRTPKEKSDEDRRRKREKKKKSHKRKHSESRPKKKSRKHHKRSRSRSRSVSKVKSSSRSRSRSRSTSRCSHISIDSS